MAGDPAGATAAKKPLKEEEDDDELVNVPLSVSRGKKASASKAKKEEEEDDDDFDNKPISYSRAKKGNEKPKSAMNSAKASKVKKEENESDEDFKLALPKKSGGAAASARTSKVKKIKDEELDDVKILLLPLTVPPSMAPPSAPPLPLPVAKSRLLILYASQTGNAVDVARRVGGEAVRGGCPSVDVLSMDIFDPSYLPDEGFVVFIVSTMGQGDPPDSMKGFWKYLLQKNLGPRWLEGLQYAVFGLGDSGYQKYNFPAKKLDRRLFDLGARQIIKKGLGDDKHPAGYEGALDPWLQSLWQSLNETNAPLLPRIMDILHPNLDILGGSNVEVMYHRAPQDASISDSKTLIGRARSMSPALKFHDDGEPPYMLQIVTNQRLTTEESERDVRHFELEDPCSAIRYQAGDALEILPCQNPSAVDAFIKRCNLDPECYITVRAKDLVNGPKSSLVNVLMDRIKLKTFVALTMDVASASPRRYFFEIMSYFATAEPEKRRLKHLASPAGRGDLYAYNQKENLTVLKVLQDFPSVQMPFQWLVQLTPPLKKRAYSISSSPLAHPNQIHLTVSIVSWLTPECRRHGLCSSWLAGLSPTKENLIPCWIRQGSLPRPLPSVPLMLIGPGTGCAPFRAFVEERAAQAVVEPTAPVLFFFGCRNQDSDFLYKDFWLNHAQNHGVLSVEKGGGFFVAFSRDQPQKIYVQDKIKEQSARVINILSCDKVVIYVVGCSTKMPVDVTAALEEVICKESGDSKENVSDWLKDMKRAGNFIIEGWS